MSLDKFFDMEQLKDIDRQHDLAWDKIENGVKKMTGIVVRIVEKKGFGFIRGKDGIEYFFHKEDVNGFFDDITVDVEAELTVEVEFDVVPSQKGPRAGNVSVSVIRS